MVAEVAPEVAVAGDTAEDAVAEVAAGVVAAHLIQATWQRAYPMQTGLHFYLRKRRKLEKRARRKEHQCHGRRGR